MVGFWPWLGGLPVVTAAGLALLWAVHVFRVLTGWASVGEYSLQFPLVLPLQGYRLATGPLLHMDGLHVTLNTLALASIGPKLESAFGSVMLMELQLVCLLLSSLGFVCLLQLASWGLGYTLAQQAVGYSGALFAMFVIEAEVSEDESPVSLFGGLKLSRRAMPWCMLVLIQVFIPSASFVGHLSGALVGLGLSRGLGARLFQCKFARLDSKLAAWCPTRHRPAFVGTHPFVKSQQHSLFCCQIPTIPQESAIAPPPPPTTFPSTPGHRLGSV
ncbi:hypothetical protein BASA81_002243 [Batrachochytrium salamandrivorans]|nr:hypothetical protein BASA81_002243 [Batrachochytrium salamandrivorans]